MKTFMLYDAAVTQKPQKKTKSKPQLASVLCRCEEQFMV